MNDIDNILTLRLASYIDPNAIESHVRLVEATSSERTALIRCLSDAVKSRSLPVIEDRALQTMVRAVAIGDATNEHGSRSSVSLRLYACCLSLAQVRHQNAVPDTRVALAVVGMARAFDGIPKHDAAIIRTALLLFTLQLRLSASHVEFVRLDFTVMCLASLVYNDGVSRFLESADILGTLMRGRPLSVVFVGQDAWNTASAVGLRLCCNEGETLGHMARIRELLK